MNKFFILLFFAVFFEVLADIAFKYWSVNLRQVFLWGGLVLYSAGTVLWAFSLQHEYLSKAATIFTVLNLVAVVLAGALVFGEHLSLVNKIGILLGVMSIILIQI
jgi:multidrug transporter EmrE-like cation transporter